MLFGNRGARSSGAKQRKSEAFQPRGEALEPKVLLTLLQLGAGTPKDISGSTTTAPAGPQTIGGQLPFIADSFVSASGVQSQGTMTTDPGLGILETGKVASQDAGSSVAGLGALNADGNNDYLIGAPGVSQAFLVFSNTSVTAPTTQSWLTATPEQRVGNLGNLITLLPPSTPFLASGSLGTSTQTNPFTDRGQPYNYNFDGITFYNGGPTSSTVMPTGLGTFVAAAGPNAFVIGAPNYPNGGRLYYIQASTNFNAFASAPVNLDSPPPGLTVVTFVGTLGGGLGSSFADVPNLFGDGSDDLVIGEPTASLNGKMNNGGVFVYSTSRVVVPGQATTVQVGVTPAQLTFAGANSGDEAGFSVANAGDVNGATGGVNDLLIGAPFNSRNGTNAGAAYLVYGGTTLTSGVLTNPSTGFTGVDLSRLANPPTTADPTPPQGAVFVGAGTGAMAGSTVSSAGDFNPAVSSLGDFMIGSPGNGTGRVNLFYGASTTINSTGQYTTGLIANATNPIVLNTPTSGFNPTTGTSYSIASASFVGASGGDGAGSSLSYINAGTATTSTPPSPASIILIGAPGNSTGPGGSGSVYELLGPTTGTYTTQSQPLNSTIARQYTLSVSSLAPSGTVVRFGTSVSAYANGTGDFIAGGPGYTGTLVTQSPGAGAAAMVLAALQPANSLIPLGTSPPTPVPPGPATGAKLPGTFVPTSYIPPYMFVPTVSALSAFNYAPIPLSVALQQYLPPDGFIQRDYEYNHPGKKLPPTLEERGQTQSRKTYGSSGVWTLGSKVFTRARFHPGKTYQFTHKGRVVPTQLSREKYTSEGNPLGKV